MTLLKRSVVYVDRCYITLNIKEENFKKDGNAVWCLPLPNGDYDRVVADNKSQAEEHFVRKHIPQFNHAFDIGFAVFTDSEDPFKASPRQIIDGLERRLNELKDHPEMVYEAIGYYDDSYNNWTE